MSESLDVSHPNSPQIRLATDENKRKNSGKSKQGWRSQASDGQVATDTEVVSHPDFRLEQL